MGRRVRPDRSLHPPPIAQVPIGQITLEYVCSAAAVTTYTVTRGNIRRAIISETGATTGFCLFDDILLTRVGIWSLGNPNLAAVQQTSVSLEFLTTGAPGRVERDVGNPFSPAHLSVVPPPHSFAALWSSQANDADQLFVMQVNPGDIVRLYIQYTLQNGAMTAVTTGGGGTNGLLVFNALNSVTLLSTASNASGTLWA